jgi:hypothetical protein
MANLPTYGRNEAAITARSAQTPNADFSGGMNLGASSAPGVGIATVVVNPKLSDWTVEDQFEAARAPQGTQHIGGLGIEDGNADVYYPVQYAKYDVTPGVDDINDQAYFVAAAQQAIAGGDMGGGVLNLSDQTVEIGDRVWGSLAVA